MNHRQPARRQDQPAIADARERRDGPLDFAGVAQVDRADLHPDRRRRGLNRGELGGTGRYSRVPKHGRTRHARRDLLEYFQPFPGQAVFELQEAGGVAARPCEAIDEAAADRIGDAHEHDRHGARRLQHRCHGGRADDQDNVRRRARPIPPRICECYRDRPGPRADRSARCGRRSSPAAASPARMP